MGSPRPAVVLGILAVLVLVAGGAIVGLVALFADEDAEEVAVAEPTDPVAPEPVELGPDEEAEPEPVPEEEPVEPTPPPTPTPATPDPDPDPAVDNAERLAAAVTAQLRRAEPVEGMLGVDCDPIDRFVAGDIHACRVTGDAPPLPAWAAVVIHDERGRHAALAWDAPDPPPMIEELVADVGGSGQFCADVLARGHPYALAVAYWLREGRPERMDRDRDGIPCGATYPPADIDAYWQTVQDLP